MNLNFVPSLIVLAVSALTTIFAQQFPVQHIASAGRFEVGQSADLSVAHVTRTAADHMALSGRDNAGKPWRARMKVIDTTEVWSADFDNDGKRDLLVAHYGRGSRLCDNWVDATVLLFDSVGRPVPSTFQTVILDKEADTAGPRLPGILLDLDHDKQAEFLLPDCGWWSAHPLDFSLSARVLEARNGRLVQPAADGTAYRLYVNQRVRVPSQVDQRTALPLMAPMGRFMVITSVETKKCPATNPDRHALGQILGRPCAEILLSSETGAPPAIRPDAVVIETQDARDLYLDEHSIGDGTVLRRLFEKRTPVRDWPQNLYPGSAVTWWLWAQPK